MSQIETNRGWGAETFLNAAFDQEGVSTTCLDYEKYQYKLAHYLLDHHLQFDALLLQRGCGYLLPQSIISAIHHPRILLFTELVARNRNQHCYLNSDLFDYIFFRSVACREWVIEKGWIRREQTGIALSAFSPLLLQHQQGTAQDIDILFIGTLLPRRQYILSQLGHYFNVTVVRAFGADMVRLLERSKIVLNIHAEEYLDTETRVYETLGCGAFLITEKLSSESPFVHGYDLIETSSLNEMVDSIAYYLSHPEERQLIARTGQHKVLEHHTYQQQAQQLKSTIKALISNTSHSGPPLNRRSLYACVAAERLQQVQDICFTKVRFGLSKIKRLLISSPIKVVR
jgi:hypothetical protein